MAAARKVDKEARRVELVAAASRVFAEKGVADTAVGDIVRTAGVAQGTFYLYFSSKDEIILAVVERLVDSMMDSAEAGVAASGDSAVERLRGVSDALAGFDSVPGALEYVEQMHLPQNRALHDRMAEHMMPRLVPMVESIIIQGVAEGVFNVPDTTAAAWFVLAGMQSVELAGTPADEMPAALRAATDLALRALGYPGQDQEATR